MNQRRTVAPSLPPHHAGGHALRLGKGIFGAVAAGAGNGAVGREPFFIKQLFAQRHFGIGCRLFRLLGQRRQLAERHACIHLRRRPVARRQAVDLP